jgi:hypothetical protein
VPLGDVGRCEGSTATLSVGSMEISVDGTSEGLCDGSSIVLSIGNRVGETTGDGDKAEGACV